MTRKPPYSNVNLLQAGKYFTKAQRFRGDAEKMAMLKGEFSGNGTSVLCVHAAIAYVDALTVRAKGQKSKSGDHSDAGKFLASVIPMNADADKTALRVLQSILSRKDQVSYADDLIDELSAEEMLDRLKKFAKWAEKRYNLLDSSLPIFG